MPPAGFFVGWRFGNALRTALATLGGSATALYAAPCSVGSCPRCRAFPSDVVFLSVLGYRPLYYSGGSLLRRYASWRNTRRRCGGPRPAAPSSGGPRPSSSTPPLRFAPATAVGGKGGRCLGGRPPGFFVGWRLGALQRLRRLNAACVRVWKQNPLVSRRGICFQTRPLRSPCGRPQPLFSPKAHALFVQRGRGPFKLTRLARQPRNNLKLSPRPRQTNKTHGKTTKSGTDDAHCRFG